MYSLTERQAQIYDYLTDYMSQKGQCPTVNEIKNHFNLASKATVAKHLEALQRRGVLRRLRYAPRGMELLVSKNEITIFIKGVVRAGQPVECWEDFEEMKVHPGMFKHPEKVFALRVSGESMIEAGILDGDLVFIEQCSFAENAKIVLASVDGEQTLKRYRRDGQRIVLQPANNSMKPIEVTPRQRFVIHGVLVGVWRAL